MSEKIVQLNEEVIKGQLKELVRGSVEETLNELLEAEAEKLTQAARYERNEQRQGYRSGHYNRNLTTTSGDVTLKMPKLKGISFETAIIERYRRRESSVEEALIEMYLAGVSVRRVEDITETLWGSKVSPSTISELTALGVPAIMVPSPYVTNNHQEKNARALETHGGVEVLLEQDSSGQALFQTAAGILHDDVRREAMASAMAELGIRDAAQRIYETVQELL